MHVEWWHEKKKEKKKKFERDCFAYLMHAEINHSSPTCLDFVHKINFLLLPPISGLSQAFQPCQTETFVGILFLLVLVGKRLLCHILIILPSTPRTPSRTPRPVSTEELCPLPFLTIRAQQPVRAHPSWPTALSEPLPMPDWHLLPPS